MRSSGKMHFLSTGFATISLLLSVGGMADSSGLPPIEKLRYQEDYSELANRPPASCWPDCWKYIPLGNRSGRYLTIGGEVRQRYEYTDSPTFGEDEQDKHGVWLQRYSLLGDLHWNRHLRFFGQLTSALETGRAAGPSPVDEDELEWQNAFLDLGRETRAGREATLRLGRQEMVLGSGRLVDVREGPNVRRTFDGGRGFVIDSRWRIDLLAARPRRDLRGVFDDDSNNNQALWGIYSVLQQPLPFPGDLDLYYLGYENEGSTYVQGTAHEDRHSLGARYWGEAGNWRWNWEALYQFGHFGQGDISAWTLATETTRRWQAVHLQPALKLSINVASGDSDPDDDDLGTFNPLYPRGNYFSEAAVFGPRNFYNFHVFLYLQPSEKLAFTTDLNLFWRLEKEDGLYSPSGQIVRGPNGSDNHFAFTALSLTAEYTFRRGLAFTAIYTHGNPEKFLREAGPSEDIGFTEITLQYRF